MTIYLIEVERPQHFERVKDASGHETLALVAPDGIYLYDRRTRTQQLLTKERLRLILEEMEQGETARRV